MKMTKCDKIFAAMKLPFLSVETREGREKKFVGKSRRKFMKSHLSTARMFRGWGLEMGESLRDCYFSEFMSRR
jgi:hypothetical protein